MARFAQGVAVVTVGAMCAGWFGTAAAVDPILLFLLRMIRDSMVSSAIESGYEAATKQPARADPQLDALARPLPPVPEGQWLRSLVDESFAHLTGPQRDELHASLMRILNDPKYNQTRGMILAEFTQQAIAMRDAHRQLARLSTDQMKALAVEARREYERLPAEQRQQMLQVLQHGIPGMPRTLNDVMLSEFRSAAPPR